MNNNEVNSTINVLKELIYLLYLKKEKYFNINIKWFLNNTSILIKERYEINPVLNLEIPGNIETYNVITKKIQDLVINNDDVFGCLTTSYMTNTRKIDGQNIRTKNIEINIPIYNRTQLTQAENINNIMLENLNNKNTKIKTLTKKTASKL